MRHPEQVDVVSTPCFATPIRVVFGECDPAGIVFFPNFYRWFDQATHDLCAAAGYAMHDVRRERDWVGYPIAEAGARFLRPVTFDENLVIETRIKEWQPRRFLLSHHVMRDGELLAEGWQTRFIGYKRADQGGRLAAMEIPPAFREAMEGVVRG
ncbi:MAG: thioesterase family protein [Burkholderiaceae bacterium]